MSALSLSIYDKCGISFEVFPLLLTALFGLFSHPNSVCAGVRRGVVDMHNTFCSFSHSCWSLLAKEGYKQPRLLCTQCLSPGPSCAAQTAQALPVTGNCLRRLGYTPVKLLRFSAQLAFKLRIKLGLYFVPIASQVTRLLAWSH